MPPPPAQNHISSHSVSDEDLAKIAKALSLSWCFDQSIEAIAISMTESVASITAMLGSPYAGALRLFVYSDASIENPKCHLPGVINDLRGQGLRYNQIGRVLGCRAGHCRRIAKSVGEISYRLLPQRGWELVERRIYYSAGRGRYRVRVDGRKIQCATLEEARSIRDNSVGGSGGK